MTHNSWQVYFNEKLGKLEESFKKQAPVGLSQLGFALKNKLITSQEYTDWAQKTYELAVISSSFFQEHPLDKKDWNNWKKLYAWKVEIQPLAQWDGHILVGCLEVPMNFPIELKPIFLLCDFNDLESSWNKKLGEGNSKSFENTLSKLSTPSISVNTSSKVTKNISDLPELILTEETSEDKESHIDEIKLHEVPVGLSEAITENFSKTGSTIIAGIDNILTSNETTKNDIKKAESREKTKTSIVNVNSNSKYILNALFDKKSDSFRNQSEKLFEKLKSHFEKTMILTLDAEEKFLHPYIWDNHFSHSSKSDETIPLDKPSAFKIVNVTQKPFHGPIVVNDVNEKFIDSWNQGTIPAHITIVPLIINNKIAGMIISLGEKSCYTFGVLKFMENAAQEFSQNIAMIIETPAA